MVFSSVTFILGYLPLALILYYIAPRRARNGILFLLSLLFYAWGEPIYVILMLISTAADYSFALYADRWNQKGDHKKARRAVYATVIFNLGMLGFFKYTDFMIGTVNSIWGADLPLLNLPLPIGISFYSFQTMSYTIDVYRGEAKPQKNPMDLGAYVALFPQLIAGPIVRYTTIAHELNHRKESWDQVSEGLSRFMIGLGKKVLIANQVGQVFAVLSAAGQEELSILAAWIGAICFALQIYFDFSGYSDMAIGLGKMLGFNFLENFNYPYVARSITDFWRRWHISLSSWFRDYVYIPLGGNRKGKRKQYRNIFIVWLLTGIWHGAGWNFVIWGFYYAVWLLLEKAVLSRYLDKLPRICQHVYTLLVVLIGWVIFSIEDLSMMKLWLQTMFGLNGASLLSKGALFYLKNYGICIMMGIAASIPWYKKWRWNDQKRGVLQSIALIGLFVICMAFLVSDTYNPFLYFRF